MQYVTDCDYCGSIRLCSDDGAGGKACSSCAIVARMEAEDAVINDIDAAACQRQFHLSETARRQYEREMNDWFAQNGHLVH